MLVVSCCTKHKAVTHQRQLTVADFAEPARRRQREKGLARWCRPAAEMYTGRHHLMVVHGVRLLRDRFGAEDVQLRILSAGYGLLRENTRIAPYDATFNTMTKKEARAWARHLCVAREVRKAIAGHELVFFLMPAPYLEAMEPPIAAARGQRLVFFAAPSLRPTLDGRAVTVVPAAHVQAARYGATVTNVKGRMFELLASALARQGRKLERAILRDVSPRRILTALDSEQQRLRLEMDDVRR